MFLLEVFVAILQAAIVVFGLFMTIREGRKFLESLQGVQHKSGKSSVNEDKRKIFRLLSVAELIFILCQLIDLAMVIISALTTGTVIYGILAIALGIFAYLNIIIQVIGYIKGMKFSGYLKAALIIDILSGFGAVVIDFTIGANSTLIRTWVDIINRAGGLVVAFLTIYAIYDLAWDERNDELTEAARKMAKPFILFAIISVLIDIISGVIRVSIVIFVLNLVYFAFVIAANALYYMLLRRTVDEL